MFPAANMTRAASKSPAHAVLDDLGLGRFPGHAENARRAQLSFDRSGLDEDRFDPELLAPGGPEERIERRECLGSLQDEDPSEPMVAGRHRRRQGTARHGGESESDPLGGRLTKRTLGPGGPRHGAVRPAPSRGPSRGTA